MRQIRAFVSGGETDLGRVSESGTYSLLSGRMGQETRELSCAALSRSPVTSRRLLLKSYVGLRGSRTSPVKTGDSVRRTVALIRNADRLIREVDQVPLSPDRVEK